MASFGQLHDILAVLANRVSVEPDSPWSRLNTQRVQDEVVKNPDRFVSSFISFIGNGAQLLMGELKKFAIDRSTPFDPAKFIGTGQSIWKGPKDGDGLTGDEEQDVRSLAITELDLSKLCFEHCLKEKESPITGETKLIRLSENYSQLIRPDARIAQALWEEPGHLTLEWIRVSLKRTWFDFPGTVLRNSDGYRYFLYLCWNDGQWFWYTSWLEDEWGVSGPSLLLAH